ncbi:glycosyltransferase family 2 protein [Demequina sp. NBRC 110053]|uniref:glycosyltransferase n=1 Tax=Demequina sp. NBRC 110053 TaxID=1570342 RepID=UPI0009FD8F3C|nr:glycosyltransferase family A protein [Demequina sp. NBRC 110053]
MRPHASVIIAAFDAASTLGEQLEALARQRVTVAWEVLVCDNGSRDHTVAVARGFADRLPLTVVDASARRGPAAARNIGAEHATGDVLLFCDADDVVADGWAHALIAALDHFEIVGSSFEHRRLNPGAGGVTWEVSDSIRMPFWPQYEAVGSGGMGVRSSAFHRAHGFDERLRTGEDVDLCWRIQLAGGTLGHAPEAVVHLRRRSGLRAVYRQARNTGNGVRQLEHKFSRVARAARGHASAPVVAAAPAAAAGGSRSRLRRLIAVRRLDDLADPVWRVGEWWGRRRARLVVAPLTPGEVTE